MRLGFYYHIPAITRKERILLPGYLGRFLDSLADSTEGLTLFLHQADPGENAKFDYAIVSPKIQLVSLPPRGSVPHRFLHPGQYTQLIKQNLTDLDGFLIRGPSPLLPPIARAVRPLKTILMIIGDQLAGVDSLPQPRWRKELIRVWSWYNAQRQLKVARHSLVFVNSKVLYRQFEGQVPHLHETRTTTLSISDMYPRVDTCQKNPINLLYTGRMDHAKGLLDMVTALAILKQKGIDAVLNLVGWAETGSTILEEIQTLAAAHGIGDRVIFHGYKAVGPELFNYYKTADIYVIASQASEGFPRTIWEAMAHCVPVLATEVGSIPDYINGAAELVPPRNPQAVASGVLNLISNKELRMNYIETGFALAKQNCLEIQVKGMAEEIKQWVEKNE